MRTISTKDIQELRRRTEAGMTDCKQALEATNGDVEQAIEHLRQKGIRKAEERVARQAAEGLVGTYLHHNGRLGVLIEVNCETDFVARTDAFRELVKQIAEHVAGAAPLVVDAGELPSDMLEEKRRAFEDETRASGKPKHLIQKIVDGKIDAFYRDSVLLHQPWIREPKKTIGDLIKETSAKVGEHLRVARFARFEMRRAVGADGA